SAVAATSSRLATVGSRGTTLTTWFVVNRRRAPLVSSTVSWYSVSEPVSLSGTPDSAGSSSGELVSSKLTSSNVPDTFWVSSSLPAATSSSTSSPRKLSSTAP